MSGADRRARTLEVARAAFERFTHALATGDWPPFFACLTDDFVFWFPAGRFKGCNTGKGRAVEFFRYVSTVYPAGLFVTLDRTYADESSVAFEFRDEGIMFGTTPYRNRVVVVFDVRDDAICGYREYFGGEGAVDA